MVTEKIVTFEGYRDVWPLTLIEPFDIGWPVVAPSGVTVETCDQHKFVYLDEMNNFYIGHLFDYDSNKKDIDLWKWPLTFIEPFDFVCPLLAPSGVTVETCDQHKFVYLDEINNN